MVNSFSHYLLFDYQNFLGSNGGHLPNSLNVPYPQVFDQTNQTLKSKDELKTRKDFHHISSIPIRIHLVFNTAGVDLSKPGIYTCQTGTTASTLAFVAHVLGQKTYSVYNVRSSHILLYELHNIFLISSSISTMFERMILCAKLKMVFSLKI
jgi:hypothetical protein